MLASPANISLMLLGSRPAAGLGISPFRRVKRDQGRLSGLVAGRDRECPAHGSVGRAAQAGRATHPYFFRELERQAGHRPDPARSDTVIESAWLSKYSLTRYTPAPVLRFPTADNCGRSAISMFDRAWLR